MRRELERLEREEDERRAREEEVRDQRREAERRRTGEVRRALSRRHSTHGENQAGRSVGRVSRTRSVVAESPTIHGTFANTGRQEAGGRRRRNTIAWPRNQRQVGEVK